MDANILSSLLSGRIDPSKYELHGLDVVFRNHADETPENRAIIADVIQNYDTFADRFIASSAMQNLREDRNAMLSESDWTQVGDSPLSDTKKQEWRTYRQTLRDLPANTPDPLNPSWPAMPA